MNSNAEIATIAELDLDPIKVKIMHAESGEGWSRGEVDAVEFEYRRFLCLMKLFPHEQVAPRFDVDIFWHYHILDTMKYAADCEQIFGYFLHHFPYAGLRGEDDEAAHHRVGVRMQELYEATFGGTYDRRDDGAGASAITAFSIPVTNAKTAFSIPVSAANAKTAFSIPVSAANAKTAFSIPVSAAHAKTASSIPMSVERGKTAFSIPVSVVQVKTAFSIPASMPVAQNDPFYTVRPSLALAA